MTRSAFLRGHAHHRGLQVACASRNSSNRHSQTRYDSGSFRKLSRGERRLAINIGLRRIGAKAQESDDRFERVRLNSRNQRRPLTTCHVHICSVRRKICHDSRVAAVCSVHQRGRTAPIGGIWVGAQLYQKSNNFQMPKRGGIVQRGDLAGRNCSSGGDAGRQKSIHHYRVAIRRKLKKPFDGGLDLHRLKLRYCSGARR